MSRLGNRPVKIPNGVKLDAKPGLIKVEGPKGKLEQTFPESIEIKLEGDEASFSRKNDLKATKAAHGLVRQLVSNMVKGTSEGFSKTLESVGVGYRMAVQGNKVTLNVGYSHPLEYQLPEGIKAEVKNQTELTISGPDKELLGKVCDKIRGVRPPEPYKGKGIRYQGERIQLKEGKAAAK